ncbi:MAG: hypothetical protein K0S28_945 [Paucimonas sp.]|jgi:hypothetical protein|nr:hypothetical protein [Paucimonas sp.]
MTTSIHRKDIPTLTESASRPDLVSALKVEVALALASVLGTKVAARFLSKHYIDIGIALRVLLSPQKRRRTFR